MTAAIVLIALLGAAGLVVAVIVGTMFGAGVAALVLLGFAVFILAAVLGWLG